MKYTIDFNDSINAVHQNSGEKGSAALYERESEVLYRIIALKDFTTIPKGRYGHVNSLDVKKGDKGGYVAGYKNLSQSGNSWVDEYSMVFGDSVVEDDSIIEESNLYDNVVVRGESVIRRSTIREHVYVSDGFIRDSELMGSASVIGGQSEITKCNIGGRTLVKSQGDNYCLLENQNIFGRAMITKTDSAYSSPYMINSLDGELEITNFHAWRTNTGSIQFMIGEELFNEIELLHMIAIREEHSFAFDEKRTRRIKEFKDRAFKKLKDKIEV